MFVEKMAISKSNNYDVANCYRKISISVLIDLVSIEME
jgi:hypothetical protein